MDPVFVDTSSQDPHERNPSRDVTPIVGLVQLQDGEEFLEDRWLPLRDTGWQKLKNGHAGAAERGGPMIQNQTNLCLLPPN